MKKQMNEQVTWFANSEIFKDIPLSLHEAAFRGDFLIHKGANVNCVDDRGQSPLYIAAVNRNLNCIQILLQAAAKPNGSAHNRCTPLFFATRDGEVDIMRELINHGADINSAVHLSPKLYPNTLINTPLYISVSYNKLDCFKLLLQSGANPNFNCKRLDERNRLQSFYGEVSLVLFALFIRYSGLKLCETQSISGSLFRG
uniref:Ankyrin repeat and SOCS box protein 1-like n=1 Tax=Callorhinchus milii TaxID=7868 RepID=A0A4W3ICC3_CALMI